MRVPLSWLREYVEIELEPESLAEQLTLLGMEVQRIERRGNEWRDVVVGELLEVTKHPRADRLSLTRVRVGDTSEPLSIVCGATNIAVGQRVPVALPGAVLPGERHITVAPIAGVESQGMLCSGDELRLTSDADGILILPAGTPLGRPLAELYGETILDIDVKPNRGDCLSLVGIAREVAAATGARLRPPETAPPESGDETAQHLTVDVREGALCPRFVGRYVDGLRVGPSPVTVQGRLLAAGLRPISNVVDASNYVMLELGKPTHTFDAAAVAEGNLIVRLASAGEHLETLDHVARELTADTLVIADGRGPLAIAGVMGGAASEVGEGTTAVIIESALFDPVSIRRTAARYALRSEASLRFEKGQEHRLARTGAARAVRLLAEWAGGRVARGAVDTNPVEPLPIRIPFRPRRVSRLLGVPLGGREMEELLRRVQVETEPGSCAHEPAGDRDETLVAIVPTHRRDIELEADIAEEVARVRGYETIPAALPDTVMPGYRSDPRRPLDEMRDLLSGQGLGEVVAYGLVGPDDHARLNLPPADPETIGITNPLSVDHSELRRSLLPGLVNVLVANERQRRPDVALFELGPVHRWAGAVPEQSIRLAVLLAGEWVPRPWDLPEGTEQMAGLAADVFSAKGLLEWLLARLHLPRPLYRPGSTWEGVEHPGRTALVTLGEGEPEGRSVGTVGELDPRFLRAAEVRAGRVAFFDLDVEALLRLLPERRRMEPLPRVPASERDVAVVVEERLSAGEVEALIRTAAGPLLREVRLFDRYQGPSLRPGEVNLAYRLRLQAPERTLTETEVEEVMARIRVELAGIGGRIRS